jgi:hypothetical protein
MNSYCNEILGTDPNGSFAVNSKFRKKFGALIPVGLIFMLSSNFVLGQAAQPEADSTTIAGSPEAIKDSLYAAIGPVI